MTLSEPRLSIIVASCGRPSLPPVLSMIGEQLCPGDELLVDVNSDAPWGGPARQRMMPRAAGDFLMFMDDDDAYVPGALSIVRNAVKRERERVHMFRMDRTGFAETIWTDPVVREGNVSTQMVVVPNIAGLLGTWTERYAADFDFIESTCRLQGEPVWHADIIARYHAKP